MKKTVFLTLLLAVLTVTPVLASSNTQSTGYTYTYELSGALNISQDAYLPSGAMMDLGLYSPQDMYILGHMMYIADTGNRRVLRVNLDTLDVMVLGEDLLVEPRGISADNEGRIYVADSGASAVYRYNKDGELEFTFTKPTTPNFGRNERFNPVRVAPSDDGGVYVVSEGTTAGIIYINGRGDFLGYFASNNVDLSISQKIMNAVLTEEQRARFLRVRPSSYGQIFRGADGLIYTANRGSEVTVKKHSISGIDMLAQVSGPRPLLNDVGGIFVTEDGRMFAVEHNTGMIVEMQSEGYLLCMFGGLSEPTERVGLFISPSGVGVDDKGKLYVLDEGRNYVQIFEPTVTQQQLYRAIDLYENGEYTQCQAILQEMLKFNNTSFLGHMYMGRAYMQLANYEKAAEHYKIANMIESYSGAYWEIRNIWLQNNLGYALLVLLVIVVAWSTVKFFDNRWGILDPVRDAGQRLLHIRLVRDLARVKFVVAHPIDNAYDVHIGKTGSYACGFILFALLYVIFILLQVGMGFIFSVPLDSFSIINATLQFVLIAACFIFVNFYITSINDGNGTLKDIFLCVAYGFSPVILFMPLVILFANVATLNESFIVIIATGFLLAWSVVNIFVSLSEVHEYSFKEMVVSLLLTFFFMLVVILAASIFYMLARQVYDFVHEIVTEVALRV